MTSRDLELADGSSTLPGRDRLLTLLFASTSFIGAGLLFMVQPLVAKELLPSYGGAATLWSTATLFFQLLLLAAYGYAHASTRRFGPVWQPRVHLLVLALPLLALPLAMPGDAAPQGHTSPEFWLLRTLVLMIGLPFLAVATTGPLLQRWYSWGRSARADDPYFLFAASNLGSFVGLLAYPFLIEPALSLQGQRTAWSVGFVVFILMTIGCALSVRAPRDNAGLGVAAARGTSAKLTRAQVLRWTGLAFLPSSLMLSVTAHLSTDIAAIPLLWVVPLAIYLATFVAAFARTTRTPPVLWGRLAVATGVALAIGSLIVDAMPLPLAIGSNLAVLALVGYAAHARLAAERAHPDQLTAFYFVVAVGGALGGVLNGLVAPMVFDRVLEYPLVMVAIPLLVLGLVPEADNWLLTQVRASRYRAGLVVGQVLLIPLLLGLLGRHLDGPILVGAFLVAAGAVAWWAAGLPQFLAMGVALLYAASSTVAATNVIEYERTFYGSYTVERTADSHQLIHGTTLHGSQFLDPQRRRTPTTYYSRGGPLGDVFALRDYPRVGAVGLGVGTVAAYGEPGHQITFFEIDPEVVRIAEDPRLFSFLSDSAAEVRIVLGDGRLSLAEQPPASYDLLVLDAFSSDSIPVHLLTEEAMRMYGSRLAPDGVLAVHISNRLFDLEPVLAAAAHDLGWSSAIRAAEGNADGTPSTWVVLTPEPTPVDTLLASPGWRQLRPDQVRWTDDYSSVLSVLS